MKELDLLLGGWLEREWFRADAGRRASFERLLEEQDTQIAAWLLYGARPDEPPLAQLVDEILSPQH